MNLHDTKKILNSYPDELSGGMLQRVMIALSGDKGAIIHRYSANCALPGAYERWRVHKGQAPCGCFAAYPH